MNKKTSLIKQLTGALVGAALALTFYSGYKMAAPHLKAYVQIFTTREEPARFAQTNLDKEDQQYARRVARNQEIVRRFAAPVEEVPGFENDAVIEDIVERAREVEERLGDFSEDADEDVLMEEGSTEELEDPVTTEPTEETVEEIMMEEVVQDWETEIWSDPGNVEHSEAAALPDSGIAVTASALAALIGSSAVALRKKRQEIKA